MCILIIHCLISWLHCLTHTSHRLQIFYTIIAISHAEGLTIFLLGIVLRRMAPLAGAWMLKMSLLINELTFLIGNAMWLVVLCWLSAVCPRSVRACDSIGGNGLCVRFPPCACARAYFARYLTVTVKICTLEIIFPVLLASSLVLWDSP